MPMDPQSPTSNRRLRPLWIILPLLAAAALAASLWLFQKDSREEALAAARPPRRSI